MLFLFHPPLNINIMNTDSKLKRFIVLLDKAPFILFLEGEALPYITELKPILNVLNLSSENLLTTVHIEPEQDLRQIIAATNMLDDPLAYNIIEALAVSIPSHIDHFPVYFPVHFFTASFWQMYIEWQNVDDKPEPAPVNRFTITIDILTHELSITDDANTVLKEKVYEGVIHIESLDTKVPFPQALLKECTMDVYDIIVQTSVSRAVSDKTKSKYLLVMQTGQETFNYINLRQIEKDLTAAVKKANFTIEE